jgi:hypothetical protein
MSKKPKEVIRQMQQQGWFALDEYMECRKKLRFAKLLKHGTPPLWLIFMVIGVLYDIPWWLLLISSTLYVIWYVKSLPNINHTIKVCKMTMFCLEIEFDFSKIEDNLELAKQMNELLKL